jgi:hypothetical protein
VGAMAAVSREEGVIFGGTLTLTLQ